MTDSKTQAGGVEIPKNMSNDELKAAIDYAFQKLYSTGSASPHYAPMLEHYKALLKEQEHRAQAALIAADAQDALPWQAMALAKLGYVRDAMTPEEVLIVQTFIGPLPTDAASRRGGC